MKALGYTFKDEALLSLALSHRSVGKECNERMEFLGDSILGMLIAEEMYHAYPDMKEGEMSRLRSSLVNGESLARLGRSLGLSEYVHLGPGERKSGGKNRDSILADSVEAVIAAIYLDAGLSVVRDCVLRWYRTLFPNFSELEVEKDAKSRLQEWLQARQLPLPVYEVVDITGPSHEQLFTVACYVEGMTQKASAQSTSRRKAEQLAADIFMGKCHD